MQQKIQSVLHDSLQQPSPLSSRPPAVLLPVDPGADGNNIIWGVIKDHGRGRFAKGETGCARLTEGLFAGGDRLV